MAFETAFDGGRVQEGLCCSPSVCMASSKREVVNLTVSCQGRTGEDFEKCHSAERCGSCLTSFDIYSCETTERTAENSQTNIAGYLNQSNNPD